MSSANWSRGLFTGVALGLVSLTGCSKPAGTGGGMGTPPAPANTTTVPVTAAPPVQAAPTGTANVDDVTAAKARIDALGDRATYAPKTGDLLTEIVIKDGSNLTADDLALFGKLSDLTKLQIMNSRSLNDEMAAHLSGLKELTSLSLTNTVINDATVEMIVKSFPKLIELDLSSNTNMTGGVVKILGEMPQLQRLSLLQNRVNDISAQRLSKLQNLRVLDLRGNMEAGDMALEVVAALPKLSALKHRSTAVSDSGIEYLSQNQTLDSLLMQDFNVTDQSGPLLAKMSKLTQLEIFRCQGFGSEGVLALKGMGLTRLTLRDLPSVDDRAMEVFEELPSLKRLYLHELASVGDDGLKHLAALKNLELLDIWSLPRMTDATVDVILELPKLKELSVRETSISDEGMKKLSARTWTKLTLGGVDATEAAAP